MIRNGGGKGIRTVSPSWKGKYRTRSTPFLHSWASGRGTEGSNPCLSVTESISPVRFRGCRQRARKIQATRFPVGTYPNSSEALVTSLTRVSLPLGRDNEFPPSPQRRIEGISTERPFARSACLHHRFFNGRGGFRPDGLWRELVPRRRAGRVKRGRMGFFRRFLGRPS